MELEDAKKFIRRNFLRDSYCITDINTEQAIRTILQELENKEKEISNLRWKNEMFVKSIKSHMEVLQNSIPKKKIEDKMRKLEHLIEEVKDIRGLGFDCIEYKGAIKILQELLEDK